MGKFFPHALERELAVRTRGSLKSREKSNCDFIQISQLRFYLDFHIQRNDFKALVWEYHQSSLRLLAKLCFNQLKLQLTFIIGLNQKRKMKRMLASLRKQGLYPNISWIHFFSSNSGTDISLKSIFYVEIFRCHIIVRQLILCLD